jgi:hypothetical protein
MFTQVIGPDLRQVEYKSKKPTTTTTKQQTNKLQVQTCKKYLN